MSTIIPLIRDGKKEQAEKQVAESLKSITRTHLDEEKKRVAAHIFENLSIPNTKGSVAKLDRTLVEHGYQRLREAAGAANPVGKVTLFDYKKPLGEDLIRLHHMIKNEGGEHIGWGHLKRKLGEAKAHPVKTGTGNKSLSTYLTKLVTRNGR